MPKGGASSLIPVYAGLQEDLDIFMKAFITLKSQRFVEYKKMFQDRRIIQLHNGRSDSAEIIEVSEVVDAILFNERLLLSCLPYMEENVGNGAPRSLEERLFGLYSLYTFFYTQVPGHVVKIRIDPDAARNFRKFAQFLLEENIYDAYMICLKLLEDKAFKHVAFIPLYDPTLFKRFGDDNLFKSTQVLVNVNDPLIRVKTMLDSPVFLKLGLVHDERTRLFPGSKSTRSPNALEICENILNISSEAMNGNNFLVTPSRCSALIGKRKPNRLEIRQRAYGSDVALKKCRRISKYLVSCSRIPVNTFQFASVDENNNNTEIEWIEAIVKTEGLENTQLSQIPNPELPFVSKEFGKKRKLKSKNIKNCVASNIFCLDDYASAERMPELTLDIHPSNEKDVAGKFNHYPSKEECSTEAGMNICDVLKTRRSIKGIGSVRYSEDEKADFLAKDNDLYNPIGNDEDIVPESTSDLDLRIDE